MAYFMNPGAMFLGVLGTSEQRFLVKLIETARKEGYTRFVEPCAGTFAMANLAIEGGWQPEQIETSDVSMMPTILGYAVTDQSLESLEIRAQGFDDDELLDPATGHQEFYDLCMDARALVLCYQEKRAGEAVGYTIYGRSGTRADLNAYITTNREEEATALAQGKKIKRPSESKMEPLECSIMPRDYEIREDSKVQILQINTAQAQYYRTLWTHNFVGSAATFNRALLIDGLVAGVFGVSKMQSESLFVWYVMKVPHERYRLGRLCYMLAQNRCFTDTITNDMEREKVTRIRTAMLTKYPENKEVRGIMKLVNRVKDKHNGYKLTYEAGINDSRTEQQTFTEWHRREMEWLKNKEQRTK